MQEERQNVRAANMQLPPEEQRRYLAQIIMQFEVFMELLPLEAQQSVITQVTEELRSEAATNVAADIFSDLPPKIRRLLLSS